jgi:hypothetical protein
MLRVAPRVESSPRLGSQRPNRMLSMVGVSLDIMARECSLEIHPRNDEGGALMIHADRKP